MSINFAVDALAASLIELTRTARQWKEPENVRTYARAMSGRPDKRKFAFLSLGAGFTFASVGIPHISVWTYLEFFADALTVFGVPEVIWATNLQLKAYT
jgi:hypothetical protein